MNNDYMNIIEQMYNGDVNPIDKRHDHNSKYAALLKKIIENEKKIAHYLSLQTDSKEVQKLFSELSNDKDKASSFDNSNNFIDEFRVGAKFMLDTFVVTNDSVIRDIITAIQKNFQLQARFLLNICS